MNTFQNLIDNGIEPHTAQDMLDGYIKRIGTMNGVYEIPTSHTIFPKEEKM